MTTNRTGVVMDLADFLADKLSKSNYRRLAKETGVSRGALEHIIKRQNTDLPKIETLTRIALTYGMELWEVMQMAGIHLGLPQNDTERSQRLAQLVARKPSLDDLVKRLAEKMDTDPGYVDGMILALEAGLNRKSPLP